MAVAMAVAMVVAMVEVATVEGMEAGDLVVEMAVAVMVVAEMAVATEEEAMAVATVGRHSPRLHSTAPHVVP